MPEITGSAHVTGFHQFTRHSGPQGPRLDPRDRLAHGFSTESA